MAEWIKVSERLPEAFEEVLCYSDKNGGYFFLGYYSEHLEAFCKDGLMHCYNVLYWCPLEAPR